MKMKDDYHHIYEQCKDHMHAYVLVETIDGSKLDGIITGVDEEYVYIAVPIEQNQNPSQAHHQPMQRSFGHGGGGFGYGYTGYGYGGYPGYGAGHYGYGYQPRPRFRRLILPLAALTALSVLPWY